MKRILLLPILFLFIISCSDDFLLIDENDTLVESSVNLDDSVVVRAGGSYDPLCVDNCNLDGLACYNTAKHHRDLHLISCDYILIIGVEVTDIYCTRNVIVGYEDPIITPEGEVIEIPIYEEEVYVCGQEENNIYSTDPILVQEAQECRLQAQIEYVEAIDKCDINKSKCLKKCKKGPIDEL